MTATEPVSSYDVTVTFTMRLQQPVSIAEAGTMAIERSGLRRDLNIAVTDIHVHRTENKKGKS